MISISHWGMFRTPFQPPPLMLPEGFKLSAYDLEELKKPDGIIEIVPLMNGESQPVYLVPNDGDCA